MRLHHLALRVADVERSLGFYAGLLGLEELERWPEGGGGWRSAWLQLSDGVLMLERNLRGGPSAGSGHLLTLSIDSLAEWEARLAGAGAAIVDRTEATLYLLDPDGHRVGLSVFRFSERA